MINYVRVRAYTLSNGKKGVWKMECYKESEGKKVDFVIFKEEA